MTKRQDYLTNSPHRVTARYFDEQQKQAKSPFGPQKTPKIDYTQTTQITPHFHQFKHKIHHQNQYKK